MNTKQQLEILKECGQDFEWYPTTKDMCFHVSLELSKIYGKSSFTLLDIGAGDGRVFDYIQNHFPDGGISEQFAIEKAQLHISNLEREIRIIGTDFMQQTLIDKRVDVIFCNPPYSEYDAWTERILKEGNCSHVFLIIPQRWRESDRINNVIARRELTAKTLKSTDFLSADRAARATVDIIHIDMNERINKYNYETSTRGIDAFSLWFEENFNTPDDTQESKTERTEIHNRVTYLVPGRNQIEALCELYREDMKQLIENYRAACALDQVLMKEIGLSTDCLKDSLKKKIEGLKILYWKELFDKLDSITKRMTAKTREKMSSRLNEGTHVDFSEANVYAVVIWAIKNANAFYDDQLKDLYLSMTNEKTAKAYKSNRHMTTDTWRYCRREKPTHYSLEYRIVLDNYSAIFNGGWSTYDYKNGLHESAHSIIHDIFAVANNLGFAVYGSPYGRQWESNVAQDFIACYEGHDIDFCYIRCFKNGNIHIKFCIEFMRAFNIEAGRLLGWLKSPQDAVFEICVSSSQAQKFFNSSFHVTRCNLLLDENKN